MVHLRVLLSSILLAACAGGSGGVSPLADQRGTEAQPGPYTVPPEAAGPLAGGPQGTLLEPALFASHIYPGLRFKYQIYIPAQYRRANAAALMVFQDGHAGGPYLGVQKAPWVFDHLIAAGQMPVTIALFVDPGTPSGTYTRQESGLRSEQYDSLDDTYARFLLDELLPEAVLGQFNIVKDPAGWAIAGQSSGGIAAFTVAWQRPDRFRRVLTQNGSFVGVNHRGGERYPDLIRQAAPKPLRVYLLSGTGDLDNEWGSWLKANEAMAKALDEKGYAYRFRTGSGGHYPPLQGLADFPAALRWLWAGYRTP